jgi:hypothetical protein
LSCLIRSIGIFLLLATPLLALDRNAFTFTSYDLKVTVTPATHSLSATGKVILRNDTNLPQRHAVLQISSTLAWKTITVDGKPLQYVSQPYTSDIDHTGALTEAIVTLPKGVASKSSVEVEIAYEGAITADATRLTRIGTPTDVAARNDWDQISEKFTAVRGVGYVAWYPVAMDAVSLSDGSEVFEALGQWKQRHAASTMQLALCSRPIEGHGPMLIANGLMQQRASINAIGASEGSGPPATFCSHYQFVPLQLTAPTLAIGDYHETSSTANRKVFYLSGHEPAAREYAAVAERAAPLINDWFGAPKHSLQIVELADAGATPYESGPILFTPLRTVDRATLETVMTHQLTHATFDSPRPWIYEGLAHFAEALQREAQGGRGVALAHMAQHLPTLVAAEKETRGRLPPTAAPSPSATASSAPAEARTKGQPLVTTTDEVFYRSKAMYVWWMLRDTIGDTALQRALAKYRASDDKEPAYMQRLLEAEAKRSLEWFFDDWVYRDRGLPDFRVESSYPRPTIAGAYGVTVTVENLGDAAAEVPVIVRAQGGERSARVQVAGRQKAVARVLVPATPTEAVVNDGSVPESDTTNNAAEITAPPHNQ